MTLTILLLLLGFVLLIKGADWLVNGSVSLAKHYRIPELIIGLTVVSFGTSAPELLVNIISSVKGFNDVTMGNVVGSNLFNVMFILGISGVISPLTIHVKTIWKEIPFSILATLALLILVNFSFNDHGAESLNRLDGVILLLFFALFMTYIFINLRGKDENLEIEYKLMKPGRSALLIAIGLGFLVLGSRLVVDNAVEVARTLGASEKLIGITIVSVGTSLPELVTSVVAAIRKRSDIAIGNIIGSNIFNISLILGVSSLIKPIAFNKSFNTDILVLIASSLMLFAFMFSGGKHKLDRWESAILLLGYAGYITFLLI